MGFVEYSFKDLLSNIVDNRGKTCPTVENGMPLIATNCIKNDQLYPVYEKIRYVSKETYENWFRGHPEPGDMIFVCKGSPGRVAWAPDPVPFCIAQDMVAIRADETKIYSRFLFALLRSAESQHKIQNMHVGSLIPHFKKGDFANLYFQIPTDMDFQKQVGDTYLDFCLKIEQNQQLNQTLEAMAQAVFKSWFVDFEPTRAKMVTLEDGGTEEGAAIAAMTAISGKPAEDLTILKTTNAEAYDNLYTTASLFPSGLVESELGEIPEGWIVKNLEEVFVFNPKESIKKNTEAPHINMAALPTEGCCTSLPIQKEFKSGSKFRNGDILFARITPCLENGKTAIVSVLEDGNVGWGSTEFVVMRPKGPVNSAFVYTLARYEKFRIYAQQNMQGTSGRQRVSHEILGKYTLPFPQVSELLIAFSELTTPWFESIAEKHFENESLKQVRDSLLPKLLSGEIVIDASQGIQEAV